MNLARLFVGSSAVRLLGAGLQLLFTFVVARLLSPAIAGEFFFQFAVVAIASVVVRLGTESSALREVAIARTRSTQGAVERELYSRFVLVAALSIATGCGYVVLSAVGLIQLSTAEAFATSGALVFAALSGLGAEIIKAIDRPGVALVVQNVLVPACAIVVLLLSATFGRVDLQSSLFALLVGYAVSFSFAVLVISRSARPGRWVGFRVEARDAMLQHVMRSPVLLAGVMAPVVMQWSGSLMLGILASPASVAGYTVAARLASVVGLVNSAAASVVTPRLAIYANRGDAKGFSSTVHATGIGILALSIVPIAFLAIAAPWVLSLFGDTYVEYAPVLQLLMIGQLVAGLIGHGGQALVAGGNYRLAAVGPAVAVAVYVSLLIALVGGLGAVGAAIAMSVSVISGHVAAAVCLFKVDATWPIPTTRAEWRIAFRRHH